MNLGNTTAHELAAMYRNHETTVTQVIEAAFDGIEDRDADIGAFLHTRRADALAEAGRADASFARSEEMPPLTGIPVAIKDNMNLRGMRTTCGSKILEDYVPTFTSTAVERLRRAGAIVLGKTNMDEFAMGSSTENSAFHPTRNPHSRDRVPGGSSGGSAASVAAGMAVLALGSDTGGSIRQPAAFSGVVGMKPTYGRVSRYGLVAFASSLDQIGPFSKTVRESAELLETISGFDPLDSTSAKMDRPDWVASLDKPIEGLRVGVPREYFVDGVDRQVQSKVEAGVARLEELGCRIEDVSLPHTSYAVATYYLIATAEASSNLARYDGVRYGYRASGGPSLRDMYRQTRKDGFGKEVKRRILLGTYALSAGYYDAYYLKAQKVRTLILDDFRKAFGQVDVIVTPTTPTTAFKLDEKVDDPLSMYLSDIFTITCNLAGLPGISVPCGTSSEGLPVGMQLIGNHFREDTILSAAHQFEMAGGFKS